MAAVLCLAWVDVIVMSVARYVLLSFNVNAPVFIHNDLRYSLKKNKEVISSLKPW